MTQHRRTGAIWCSTGIQILPMPEELDLTTADSLTARGLAAIASRARLLLLDLTSLSFCDARGLTALIRIANHADKAGCRYALIAPRPPVVRVLRITRLDQRMPVFATIAEALAHFGAVPAAYGQRRGTPSSWLPQPGQGGEPVAPARTHRERPAQRLAKPASVVEMAQDRLQRRRKDAYGSSRSAGQSRYELEEFLLAAMESAITQIEATARIQRETAEMLRGMAARNRSEAPVRRLRGAKGPVQVLAPVPDPAMAQRARRDGPGRRLQGSGRVNPLAEPLTAREATVLRLLRGTLSLREIGQELHVSQNTIKSHTSAIYRKLGVSSRTAAIQRGREFGMLSQSADVSMVTSWGARKRGS